MSILFETLKVAAITITEWVVIAGILSLLLVLVIHADQQSKPTK